MPFRGVPEKVTLVCEACGSTRQVDDRPVRGVPLAVWWAAQNGRCTRCFDAGRVAPLPDPGLPIPLPSGHDHPDTSRRAARLAAPRAGSQRALLLDLAVEVGSFGFTAYEASVAIGRSPNQTATRLQELRDGGWLEYATDDAGNRLERPTTPGCSGLVQRLGPDGRRQWRPTGYHGLELPAPAEDDTSRAMRLLEASGLLDGAVVVSAGVSKMAGGG